MADTFLCSVLRCIQISNCNFYKCLDIYFLLHLCLFVVEYLGTKQRTHEDNIVPLSQVITHNIHPERDMCVVYSTVRGKETNRIFH